MFKNPFKKKTPPKTEYELVESELDEEHFRQGIRMLDIKYLGVIFTVSPMVKMTISNGIPELRFDFTIEANPNKIEIKDSEIRPVIGMIILDMIDKDNHENRISDSKHSA
jgi:hypothetical protein